MAAAAAAASASTDASPRTGLLAQVWCSLSDECLLSVLGFAAWPELSAMRQVNHHARKLAIKMGEPEPMEWRSCLSQTNDADGVASEVAPFLLSRWRPTSALIVCKQRRGNDLQEFGKNLAEALMAMELIPRGTFVGIATAHGIIGRLPDSDRTCVEMDQRARPPRPDPGTLIVTFADATGRLVDEATFRQAPDESDLPLDQRVGCLTVMELNPQQDNPVGTFGGLVDDAGIYDHTTQAVVTGGDFDLILYEWWRTPAALRTAQHILAQQEALRRQKQKDGDAEAAQTKGLRRSPRNHGNKSSGQADGGSGGSQLVDEYDPWHYARREPDDRPATLHRRAALEQWRSERKKGHTDEPAPVLPSLTLNGPTPPGSLCTLTIQNSDIRSQHRRETEDQMKEVVRAQEAIAASAKEPTDEQPDPSSSAAAAAAGGCGGAALACVCVGTGGVAIGWQVSEGAACRRSSTLWASRKAATVISLSPSSDSMPGPASER
mmetsp:Transcript_5899/g.16781  ORF Transcript_5899/g.16781 Transcript_5899/m.16781 type:complete len:492 (-) Transcript_5899:212-1687(-)